MTDVEPEIPAQVASHRSPITKAAALAIAILGGWFIYGMMGQHRKETAPGECAAAKTVAERIAPLANGTIAALTVAKTPRPLVELAFEGADGEKHTLSELRGKTILLNLWATWCIPCREEMPALDRLQARLGDASFEVVAISIDTARLDKRKAFLSEAGVQSLQFYADPTAEVFQVLKKNGKVVGLPTTLLIDPHGCEVAQMAGPADWSSDEALRLIEAAKRV